MNRNGLILVAILLGIVLIALGVWFFFFSPPKGTDLPQNPPLGQAVETDATISDQGQYYEARGTYPNNTPFESSVAVPLMKGFVEDQIASFKKDSRVEDLTPEDIEIQGLGGDRKYALEIEYKKYDSKNTVSYVFSIYADTLGAHPNGYHRTFVFDTRTGAQITLNTLFTPSAPYLETLSTIARAKLPDVISAYTKSDADIAAIESGTEPKEASFQNFYIDNGKLIIIFSPYAVGPYAIGTQLLPISLTELNEVRSEYK